MKKLEFFYIFMLDNILFFHNLVKLVIKLMSDLLNKLK